MECKGMQRAMVFMVTEGRQAGNKGVSIKGEQEQWGCMENEGGRKKPSSCEWESKVLTLGAAQGLGRSAAQVQGRAGEGD